MFFGWIVSISYHTTREDLFGHVEFRLNQFITLLYFVMLIISEKFVLDYILLSLITITISMYNLGKGRKDTPHRTSKYIIFHTLFHIFGGLTFAYPLVRC